MFFLGLSGMVMSGRKARFILHNIFKSFIFLRYSPCRSPLHFRSVSSLSVSSPDLLASVDVNDKLQEMEQLIKKQKEVINQQKQVIDDQTEKIEELETSVKMIKNECGEFEEID